jgi:PAS domain S-box-containing protein
MNGAASPSPEAVAPLASDCSNVASASPIGIGFLVDRVFQEVNDRLCEITGYRRDELIGSSQRLLCPSDAVCAEIGDAMATDLARTGGMRLDTQMRRKDGQVVDIALQVIALKPADPGAVARSHAPVGLDTDASADGHRTLAVPALRDGVVAAVLTVASKDAPYRDDEADLLRQIVSMAADGLAGLHARADLRASETRAELASDVAGIGVWDWDIGSGRVSVNPAYLRMLGMDPEPPELDIDVWTALIHPDDRDRIARESEAALASDATFRTEYRLRTVTGDWCHVLTSGRVFERDAQGRPRRMMGTHIDITELKRTEAELEAARGWLRLAVEGAELGLFEIDVVDGVKHLIVDDHYLAQVGLSRADGEFTVERWFELLHPDDHELMLRLIADLDAGKADAWAVEYRLRHADGEWRWILDRSRVFERSADGGVLRAAGAHIDITELRRTQADLEDARARLALAVEGGELGLFEVKIADDVSQVTVDDGYLAQIGLTREDAEFTVQRWVELLHPDDREQMLRMIADTDAGQLDAWDTEYRLRHADGSWRWILDRSRVFERSADGRRQRIAGAHVDITQRKAAETALAELNRTLERRVAEQTAAVRRQAEQLRALAGQLHRTEQRERKRLASILHDHIQQLIVAAQLQLNSIRSITDTARLREAVQDVGGLLKEALEASRSLTIELCPPVLHESGLIGGLNWLASSMRERYGLAVRLRAEPAAEPADEETRFLLFECARELLLNIVKHAGCHQAEVTLLRPEPTEIRLVVGDDGRGFEPDALEALRPEEMTFGLFSIQERLTQLGGQVRLESAPARGTCATLILPVPETAEPAASAETALDAPSPAVMAFQRRPRRCRVLIVDDHAFMRQGLAGLLQIEPDMEIVGEAADGEQAVALTAELEPDAIIMDINLGDGIDGIEATRRILAATPGVVVIGLSMHAADDVANAMQQAGAAAYFSKGAPPEHLVEAIRAHHGA